MGRRTRTKLGPLFSEGSRLSWLALWKRGWTFAELRKRLRSRSGADVRAGVVDHWFYGDGDPSTFYAVQLKELLGTPVEAWGQRPPAAPFTLADNPPAVEAA